MCHPPSLWLLPVKQKGLDVVRVILPSPFVVVIWRRKSDPNPLTIGRRTFVDDERISVQHVPLQPNWTLIIKQVRLDDAGEYECQVASTDRHLRRSVFLTVKGKTYVEKGSKIQLMCNVTDYGNDDIDWFRNGQKLTSNDDKKITIHKRVSMTTKTSDSVLEVEAATLEDSGIYVCRSSEMLIDSTRVDVLNGTHFSDTNNVKRVTVYVICWVPFGVISVLDVFDPKLKYSLTRGGNREINGLFKCLRTSIRNTRYISRICYRKKPVVLKRKKSDSHRTPSSFASLKSGTLEHDTRDKVKDPSVKQTDDVTL
ncbi:Hemicentin-1 [Bulinus truncatus]|nr:Hemicentin-1 [Bulinus truncatus]